MALRPARAFALTDRARNALHRQQAVSPLGSKQKSDLPRSKWETACDVAIGGGHVGKFGRAASDDVKLESDNARCTVCPLLG